MSGSILPYGRQTIEDDDIAAVTAALSVRFLVNWLTRHGLAAFAWYRLAVAGVLTVLLASGFLQ